MNWELTVLVVNELVYLIHDSDFHTIHPKLKSYDVTNQKNIVLSSCLDAVLFDQG